MMKARTYEIARPSKIMDAAALEEWMTAEWPEVFEEWELNECSELLNLWEWLERTSDNLLSLFEIWYNERDSCISS